MFFSVHIHAVFQMMEYQLPQQSILAKVPLWHIEFIIVRYDIMHYEILFMLLLKTTTA